MITPEGDRPSDRRHGVALFLRVPPEMKKDLTSIAGRLGMSVNSVCNTALQSMLDDWKKTFPSTPGESP